MAVSRLDQLVQFYFVQALAPSTTRSYESAKKRYLAFCTSASMAPLPVTEPGLMGFVVSLAADGLTSSSIKCYLSAVRHLQLSFGMGDPKVGDMATLQLVLRGVKSAYAKKGLLPRPRLPITPSILLGLRRVWERDAHDYKSIMLWAACTTCFFGFLRSGELTAPSAHDFDPGYHLLLEDVALDSHTHPKLARIRIKASKTDPFRKGLDIFLGSTDNRLCPVAALAAYLAIRGHAPGPLFRFASGSFLTRVAFVREVRKALAEAGFNSAHFAGHSFRKGAASTAAAVGMEDSIIKILGRWESSAYQLYVQLPREQLASMSARLAPKQ